MAMVTIERAGNRTRVSRGSYEKIFKKRGYRVVSEDKTKTKKTKHVETNKVNAVDEEAIQEQEETLQEEAEESGEPDDEETIQEQEETLQEEAEESGEPDIETIPISDMTKEQLIEFAKKHNISLAGTRNPREARTVIKKAMQKRKM